MSSVQVLNATRARPVAAAAEVARGPVRRGMGLMGRRGWPSSDGLVLEHCNSIHSFFMRMPIDVLYVDAHGEVVRALTSVRPWRFGPISWRTKWVLELPTGAIEHSGTRVGDRLEVVPGRSPAKAPTPGSPADGGCGSGAAASAAPSPRSAGPARA